MDEQKPNEADEQQEQEEPDYKALYEQLKSDSRKWEDRAKANKAKADKWDAASAGEDSLESRIAKLEADKHALEQEKERQKLVAKVAAATGLTEAIVATLNGPDESALTEQAKAIAGLKPKGAPNVPEAGKFPRGQESDDEERAFVRRLFNKD
jgi:hypothetical protein